MNISISHFQKLVLLTIFTFFILTSLNSCSLFTSVTPTISSAPFFERTSSSLNWGADAFPGYACPDDSITLAWHTDPGSECEATRDCTRIYITDNLGLLTDDCGVAGGACYFDDRYFGSYINGSISDLPSEGPDSWDGENPVFRFNVANSLYYPGSTAFEDRFSEVQIVQNPPPAPAYAQNFSVPAVCTSTGEWDLGEFELHTNNTPFRTAYKGFGGCVRIVRVCYRPETGVTAVQRPSAINLTIVGESETVTETIEIGNCFPRPVNLTRDTLYRVEAVVPPLDRYEGSCGGGGDTVGSSGVLPPYTQLEFEFGCETNMDECDNPYVP